MGSIHLHVVMIHFVSRLFTFILGVISFSSVNGKIKDSRENIYQLKTEYINYFQRKKRQYLWNPALFNSISSMKYAVIF